eukprot:m.66596 g.66596  ORF g.66596 m.66596 type:complete len:185 (-) comp12126_c1_seq1:1584-2138(-)
MRKALTVTLVLVGIYGVFAILLVGYRTSQDLVQHADEEILNVSPNWKQFSGQCMNGGKTTKVQLRGGLECVHLCEKLATCVAATIFKDGRCSVHSECFGHAFTEQAVTYVHTYRTTSSKIASQHRHELEQTSCSYCPSAPPCHSAPICRDGRCFLGDKLEDGAACEKGVCKNGQCTDTTNHQTT